MALTKCNECGHQISKTASACPNCGAKVKRTSLFTKIVAGFFALIVLMMVIGQQTTEKERSEKAAQEAAQRQAEQARLAAMTPEQRAEAEKKRKEQEQARHEAEQKRLGLRWNYEENQDAMGRGKIKHAYVKSLNQVQFDFPYKGAQRATLQLRTHPQYGKDAILSIERGQFLCAIDGCTVNVRFGTGKPVAYRAVEPADHSTTVLFIKGHDQFVANTKKVEKVSVEARFYQEGNKVFEFDVSGLKWP